MDFCWWWVSVFPLTRTAKERDRYAWCFDCYRHSQYLSEGHERGGRPLSYSPPHTAESPSESDTRASPLATAVQQDQLSLQPSSTTITAPQKTSFGVLEQWSSPQGTCLDVPKASKSCRNWSRGDLQYVPLCLCLKTNTDEVGQMWIFDCRPLFKPIWVLGELSEIVEGLLPQQIFLARGFVGEEGERLFWDFGIDRVFGHQLSALSERICITLTHLFLF